MQLNKIVVKNFRCIEDVTFKIEEINNSYTFTLLGINESGKSSFLNAVSLIDDTKIVYPQDYFNPNNNVELFLHYLLEPDEVSDITETLTEDFSFDRSIVNRILINEVIIKVTYLATASQSKKIEEIVKFKESNFPDYSIAKINDTDIVIKKKEVKKIVNSEIENYELVQEELDLEMFFKTYFEDYFWDLSHKIIFWKSSPQYLIMDEINLINFSADPDKVSIPLLNCFKIAEIEDIATTIARLNNPVNIQNLEDLLSDKVSTHINKVWPEHEIKIKFKINANKLTFLIEDKDVKYNAKTTSQRSDGFRQFISFLLTLSAQNYTDELQNTILLLDEPETHLHPTAQLNLLNELIKISTDKKNNVVLFATHSNYMIDKNNIDRCYKTFKKKNSTKFEKIPSGHSSYSEVNYEVFDVVTSDYHNELYGYIECELKEELDKIEKNKTWNNEKTKKITKESLPTYIRHSIHHPENTSNKKFTDAELKKSIQLLREIKYKI